MSVLMRRGKRFKMRLTLPGCEAFWMEVLVDPKKMKGCEIKGSALPKDAKLTECNEKKKYAVLRWDSMDELWWWFQVTIAK